MGNGGSASYSVGQVIYITNTGINDIVVQGVQRPYEIIVESGGGIDINLVLSVYPNPATDFLTLQMEDFEGQNLQFQLFDMSGRLTASERITGKNTDIMVGHFDSGVYTLKVIDINSPIETKIFTFLAMTWSTLYLFAQAPERIAYQATIWDTNGNLMTDATIGIQISVLQGSFTEYRYI